MYAFLIIFRFVFINLEYDILTQQSRTSRTRAESERCSRSQLRSWCWCERIRLDNSALPSDTNIGLTFVHILRGKVISIPLLGKIPSHPKYLPAISPQRILIWEGFPRTAWRLEIDIRVRPNDRWKLRQSFGESVRYLPMRFPLTYLHMLAWYIAHMRCAVAEWPFLRRYSMTTSRPPSFGDKSSTTNIRYTRIFRNVDYRRTKKKKKLRIYIDNKKKKKLHMLHTQNIAEKNQLSNFLSKIFKTSYRANFSRIIGFIYDCHVLSCCLSSTTLIWSWILS